MCLVSKTNVVPGIQDKVSDIQTNVSQVPNKCVPGFKPIRRMAQSNQADGQIEILNKIMDGLQVQKKNGILRAKGIHKER
jgi:hypothetical protein